MISIFVFLIISQLVCFIQGGDQFVWKIEKCAIEGVEATRTVPDMVCARTSGRTKAHVDRLVEQL